MPRPHPAHMRRRVGSGHKTTGTSPLLWVGSGYKTTGTSPLLWVGSGHETTRTSSLLVGGVWAQDYQVAEQPYSCLEKLTTGGVCSYLMMQHHYMHVKIFGITKMQYILVFSYYMA